MAIINSQMEMEVRAVPHLDPQFDTASRVGFGVSAFPPPSKESCCAGCLKQPLLESSRHPDAVRFGMTKREIAIVGLREILERD